MKLSNLSVIFVIVMIPIILVLSYYISMQVDTINMQTSYNSKLLDATKEAIEAFEINTVEWNEAYSPTADSKRRDVLASINTFTTSFANSLGVGGTNKENLLTYVPAIAFTLYDGYYIYSPAETAEVIKDSNGVAVTMSERLLYIKQDDGNNILQGYGGKIEEDSGRILYQVEDGSPSDGTYNGQPFTLNLNNAKKTNSHILKPFSSYSKRYAHGDTDIIVNYTLDNYITIYGTVNGNYVVQSGYLIDTGNIPETKKESLTEKISWKDKGEDTYKTGTYTYVYTENNTKVYFMNDKPYTIDSNGIRTALEATKTGVVYKKLSITSKNGKNYYEIYQALTNSNDDRNIVAGSWYTDKNGTLYEGNNPGIDIKEDTSAINYYVEAKVFSDWVRTELRDITEISSDDNPESEDSVFNMNKREVIKQVLISDLNQAITAYSRNSEGEYQLPVLTERDWDQILRNVSITTFVQGIPIGMKTYNNYAVATSTANKEYVNPDEIYLNGSDSYYHLPGCSRLEGENIIGYRNVDYKLKSYNDNNNHSIDDDYTKYYYKHNITTNDNSDDTTRQECYYCLVQRDLFEKSTGDNYAKQETTYKIALGRERYNNKEVSNIINKVSPEIEDPGVKVTYLDENGQEIESIRVAKGTEITLREIPAETGYEKVWEDVATGNRHNGRAQYTVQENDVTFRLIKEEVYEMTFMSNGSVYNTQRLKYGQRITIPRNPTRTGYTFNGWSQEVPSTMPNHDLTVEAKWTAITYTITLDYNDGSGRKDTITGTYNQTKTLPTITSTKPRTYFNGWSESKGAAEGNISTVTITANKTYYATWVTGMVAKYKDKYYPTLQQAINQIKWRRNLGRPKCISNS